uniref:FMRFamide-like neuropeptides 13 (inferred by orthology to a C. elegans protein) n=1 Tax=Strongyloides venezuelensis TaxID=75913 RepID=A0A0K0G4M6_STRVS
MIRLLISLSLLIPLTVKGFGIEPAEIRSLDTINVQGKRNLYDSNTFTIVPYEIVFEPISTYDKRSSIPLVRFGKRSGELKDNRLITRELRASTLDSPIVRFGKRTSSGPLVRFGRSSAGPLVRFGKRTLKNSPLVRFGRATSGPLVRFGKRSFIEEDELSPNAIGNENEYI